MKLKLIFVLTAFLSYLPMAEATPACDAAKTEALQTCDKKTVDEAKAVIAFCSAQINKETPPAGGEAPKISNKILTPVLKDCESKYKAEEKKLGAFVKACEPAIKKCTSTCVSVEDAQNKQTCEEEPTENKEAAQKSQGNLAEMLGPLAQLLAALMGQPAPTEQPTDDAPDATIDKATTLGDTSFATGSVRSGKVGGLGEDTLSGSSGPAAGAPAKVEMSSAMPGNSGGGAGMGAAGASGGGSRSGERGKEDEGASKLNLASMPGGGGGGGGSGGGGRSGPGGSGVAPSRTAIEGDKLMQAVIEKGAQQRGLASGGPLGGISPAHSLDNFQKVEKRMQSERNKLNEL